MSEARLLLSGLRRDAEVAEVDRNQDHDQDQEGEVVLVRTIGVVGKWQIEKALLLALCQIVMAWHYLAYPLMSPEKPFQCVSPTHAQDWQTLQAKNHTQPKFGSGDQCYVNLTVQQTGRLVEVACKQWEFIDDGRYTLKEDFNLVCDREGLLSIRQMIFFFGMVMGCLTTGHLSDKFGRKKTMLGLMAVWSVSSLLHCVVPSGYFTLFLVLQFVLALAAQSSFTISWIWTVEILGNGKWRTVVGLSTLYFWAFGFVTVAPIVYSLPNWRLAFLAMSLPTLMFANYANYIPESPMWLISQGQVAKAQEILNEAAIRNGMDPVDDLQGVLDSAENDNEEEDRYLEKIMSQEGYLPLPTDSDKLIHINFTPGDETYQSFISMIRTPRIRECSLVFAFTWFATSFTYYGLSLNSGDVGGSGNLFLTFSLYGLMEFPAITFATIMVLCLGRRLPIMLLILVGGMACLGVAALSIFLPESPDVSRSIVALAVIGKFCITANFHALFVYTSEVYATPSRNTALSVCSVFASTGGMVAPFIAQTGVIHPTLPIAIFGFASIVAAFLMTFLPETKGRPMPQTVTDSEDMWAGDTMWSSFRRSRKYSPYERI